MRAWYRGMFVPRDADEQHAVDIVSEMVTTPVDPVEPELATPLGLRVVETRGAPDPPKESGGDDEPLTLVTDAELLATFDELIRRYKRLTAACETGMVKATTPDQQR